MEPLNCTAQVRPDRVDLWMSTQSPDGILAPIAEVAGTKPENVYVHNCFLGGGFGRRSPADFASEAVKIAKTLDVPVKMIWSRDEDTRMGRYRPMSHMRFDAALDDSGKPTAYVSHSVTPSILATAGRLAPNAVDMTSVDGLAQIPYDIANQRITNIRRETHLSSWFWRAVGKTQNVFALESFIDELAVAAKADPLDYRAALLKSDLASYRRVLAVLKEKSGWGRKLPAGTAQGVAIHESVGTVVGQVAEVNVGQDGARQDSAHRLGRGLRQSRESVDGRRADRKRRRVGADCGVVRQAVGRGRHRSGKQLRPLSHAAHLGNTDVRDALLAVGRRHVGRHR